MNFVVLPPRKYPPDDVKNIAYLCYDNWDDWGKYRTAFTLVVFDASGEKHEPGTVKIGQIGLQPSPQITPGFRSPEIPSPFDKLDDKFFSIGQNDNYYEVIRALPGGLAEEIFIGLRDCAYNLSILESVKDEVVLGESLLRSISYENIQSRFNRLAHGNATLTPYFFEYTLPKHEDIPSPTLRFAVQPHSVPPTNLHVLIGRNGVGKTRCLKSLTRAMLTASDSDLLSASDLSFPKVRVGSDWTFSGLVAVSFSAFDAFEFPPVTKSGIRGDFVGLRHTARELEAASQSGEQISEIKDPEVLIDEFAASFVACCKGPRKKRLKTAIQTLENDPLFAEAKVSEVLETSSDKIETAKKLFKRLSSGHAIVLLTITRLVELVDDRTLVILDEPEGHLHPPLLSAFIRALSDLVIARNGVAIVATHSPVVLQEVPKSCVSLLERTGLIASVYEPRIETFGENVGTLTREVFGLEVLNSGFHQLVKRAVAVPTNSYEDVLASFGGQLGAEATIIARGLIALRDRASGAE